MAEDTLPEQENVLEEITSQGTDQIYSASQWQLMWWRLKKHKLAMIASVTLAILYFIVIFADFLAVAEPKTSEAKRGEMPPQAVHLTFDGINPKLYVYGTKGVRDPATFKKVFVADDTTRVPIKLFAKGYKYKILGVLPSDRHLFGVNAPLKAEEAIYLLGTDVQGRDVWSRLMLATRISMTIGLLSVSLSLFLGVLLGGISGYYGGLIDLVIQRIIEILRSIPTIPLWMAIAASVPQDWSIIRVYFAITIIIAMFEWTRLAREVRGRFLSLRDEDFVTAAALLGASKIRIIFRHMVPSFMSHIIASSTLMIPFIIISETSLSFLGLGLRPPAISWGVMLQAAQNVQTIALTPWQLIPAVFVVVAVLAFNFLGDGLRDAADPYG
tara:strand:- start:1944 stop:3095 length:1152 start_codon:yes stop_codon:yes gene_type:complete